MWHLEEVHRKISCCKAEMGIIEHNANRDIFETSIKLASRFYCFRREEMAVINSNLTLKIITKYDRAIETEECLKQHIENITNAFTQFRVLSSFPWEYHRKHYKGRV